MYKLVLTTPAEGGPMAQRWTRERRAEHTRQILLDAAEEVFVHKGFAGAALAFRRLRAPPASPLESRC
jgi:hypothetical protein